ncbi:MAG: nitroreductase family protein, partial [Deltaproteobacteria bacterium]|nr:nitroreductase family protein [Deltaproteobacteria bacterium]
MIPKDIIFKIVEAGTWAPSGDNCQPWRFTWNGQKLLLFNVLERDTSIYNSRQRASLIAHGAVLENMDIAPPAPMVIPCALPFSLHAYGASSTGAKEKGDTGGFSKQTKFLAKAVAIHDRILFEDERLHHFV